MSTPLLSRRRWLRGSRNQNVILPLKIINPNAGVDRVDEAATINSVATTAIGSPSSVKMLFPSISTFNLPNMSATLLSPHSPLPSEALLTTTLSPPPQFAVDYRRSKFQTLLKPRKRGIRKAYPSAFETYLFDDTLPGAPSQGIRPVRLLIERLEAWLLLAKRLLHHFEVLASVETRVAKHYRKLDHVMIFPSPTNSNKRYNHRIKGGKRRFARKKKRTFYKDERLLQIHFAFQGGVRGVCDAWQAYHTNATKDHADFATFLRNEAIPTLSNIKRELKWMIKSIRSDDRLSLATLTKLKSEAAKRLKRLDRQLVFFDEHPYHGSTKQDPWLLNAAVVKQMVKVYRQENKIHETVLRLQRETLISEEQLVDEFKNLCQHIYTMRESSILGVDQGLQSIMDTFNNMDSDWINFSQHNNEHLVSETAAFRHPDQLQYPNHSHALLQPIFAARMERKSIVLHHWHEYIYVLTPAGFLHEYRNSQNYPSKPDVSIFVPHYKVSSLSTNLHHNLIFQLQPHAPSRNLLKSQGYNNVLPKEWKRSKPRLGCVDRYTWTLRAKSAADMETWIEHLTFVSERYKPSSINHLSPLATPEIFISPAVTEGDVKKQEVESADTSEAADNTDPPPTEEIAPTPDEAQPPQVENEVPAAKPKDETTVAEETAKAETGEAASTETPDTSEVTTTTSTEEPPASPAETLLIE